MNNDFLIVHRDPLNHTPRSNKLVWRSLYHAGLMQSNCTTLDLFNKFIVIKQSNLHFKYDINDITTIKPRELTLELIKDIELSLALGLPLSSLQYAD